MEQIVYLAEPEQLSTTEVKFKIKMPILPSDRPDNMFIELLQLQLDMTAIGSLEVDGLDLRLMTSASNYVSTDNNGICLGLFSFVRGSGANADYAYLTNNYPHKLLINSHQDWLEFHLYNIANVLARGSISRCKMVLRITYPETSKQISNEYRKQIPLPSRLI